MFLVSLILAIGAWISFLANIPYIGEHPSILMTLAYVVLAVGCFRRGLPSNSIHRQIDKAQSQTPVLEMVGLMRRNSRGLEMLHEDAQLPDGSVSTWPMAFRLARAVATIRVVLEADPETIRQL